MKMLLTSSQPDEDCNFFESAESITWGIPKVSKSVDVAGWISRMFVKNR